mgnify:CR=1 FL=1
MVTKISHLVFILLVCGVQIIFAQTHDIHGEVKSTVGLENIHVINKTSNVFTITDQTGKFKIKAKLNQYLAFF